MTTPHYDDSGGVSSQPEPRWYCLSIDGRLQALKKRGEINYCSIVRAWIIKEAV